ncbi:MAG: hypothetical protein KatS3mg032_0370 [Cyclobacteriaceae bacterium]|nr:MAG: hypothetical protein KatS3mg032_0370 [Cyclobacteriaceae bacterium]
MKKLFILFCSLAVATVLHAQVIKINILSPIVRTLNVQYEQALSGTSSFQLGFFYTGYEEDGDRFSGFGITPEYRFYLSETEAPEGVYIAPFLRYQSLKLEDDFGSKGTYSGFGGGLILGKQWIFKEKVVLDVFIGPSYSSGTVKIESGSGDNLGADVFDGFGLRTGLCFGLRL